MVPSDKYWQKTRCDQLDSIIEDDVISVKHSNNENFIYCNTFKIELYNKLEAIDCPYFVFPLSANLSFQIGRLKYRADQIRIQNEMTFSPELSQRINFQMTPKPNRKLDLTADMKALEELTDAIYTESPNYVFVSYAISGTVIFMVIIAGIGLLALYWFSMRKSIQTQPINGATTQSTNGVTTQPTVEEVELPQIESIAKQSPDSAFRAVKPKCQLR